MTLRRSVHIIVHDQLEGLGSRLRDVRTTRELSQRDVEKVTDNALTTAGVSRLETGDRRDPQLSTLLTLCMAYDMDLLLTRRGEIKIRGTNLNGAA